MRYPGFLQLLQMEGKVHQIHDFGWGEILAGEEAAALEDVIAHLRRRIKNGFGRMRSLRDRCRFHSWRDLSGFRIVRCRGGSGG